MRRFRFIAIALGVAAACLAGCNIFGTALYFVHGPEKTEPLYTLDPDRPTVVFIDDRANILPRRTLRQTIADTAEAELLKDGAVKSAVASRAAMGAATADKADDPMRIVDIGKAVQAEVVIYAVIDQFAVSPDGQSYAPAIAMRVKVIDVTNDKRIWPPEDEKRGILIVSKPEVQQGFTPQNLSEATQSENAAARRAGLALAQLFYQHEARATVYQVSR